MHRLLVLGDSYTNAPRVLEAVSRNMHNLIDALDAAMTPASELLTSGKGLLERCKQLEKSLLLRASDGDPVAALAHKNALIQVNQQLTQSLGVLENAVIEPRNLRARAIQEARDMEQSLPGLWQQQYLMPPLEQTYFELWEDMGLQLEESAHNFSLRLDMEVPQTPAAWLAVGVRTATLLLFGTVFVLLVRRRGQDATSEGTLEVIPPSTAHSSLPWLLTGASLIVGATTTGQTYQGLLTLGSVLLIIGQVSLAWALRRPQNGGSPCVSPFITLYLTALAGYVLLYPALPLPLLALLWAGVLLVALLWHRKAAVSLPMGLEDGVVRGQVFVFWLSLLLLVMGMPRQAILLCVLYTAVAAALQLGMGGMHALYNASLNLPKEGLQAVMGSIWLACIAPIVIVVVVLGLVLWVVTLPGGYQIFRVYALDGFDVGQTHFNLVQILLIVSVFYMTRTIIDLGSTLFARLHSRGILADTSLIPPLQTAFTYSVWGLFGLFVLKSLGMELSSLAVVAGGLSVGIGFGMQAIVNNFLSGLILIFSRTLQVGDVVEVGGFTGTVRKISVRATTIETGDNAIIYVPNAEFVSNRLVNWTHNSNNVRRKLSVGVAYGSDTELVSRLMLEAARNTAQVLRHPAPSVLFEEFGDNALHFTLRFWVPHFFASTSTASALRSEIDTLFRRHRIEIPFPQVDVHLKETTALARKARPRRTDRNAPPRGKTAGRRLHALRTEHTRRTFAGEGPRETGGETGRKPS